MSAFGRKAKRMAWGERFFAKNLRERNYGRSCGHKRGLKNGSHTDRFFRAGFEPLEERRLLAPLGGGFCENFLPGSLIHNSSIGGEITSAIDEDTFVVELDQYQTLTAVVGGDEMFRPQVTINGPDGLPIGGGYADAPGDKAVAQTVAIQSAGSYTIHVSGMQGSTGLYDVQLTLNAAEELENLGKAPNNSLSAAESIDGSFLQLSGGVASRAAVVGALGASAIDEDWFSFTLDAGTTADLLAVADAGELPDGAPAPTARPQIELFDAAGAPLALGIDAELTVAEDATALAHSIENFVVDSGGTFYARVTGQDLNYTFLLTVNSAFDSGNNTNTGSPEGDPALLPWEGGLYQDISGRQGVLGKVGDGGSTATGWTFMVYLDADNNLEGAGIEDFLEMAAVGSTEDVHIVVQMDRTYGYDYLYGDWSGTRRGLVGQGDVPDTSWGIDIGEADMGSPQSVIDFVQWSMQEYPAANYGLVYWDHGNGFEGLCTDYSSGSELEMTELSTVIDAIGPINLVGFDACMMGMLEIAYQYREGADVMVASEASEWRDGWEYQNFLDKLVADPSMDAATLGGHIVDAFEQRYDYSEDSTLSAIDLTQLASSQSQFIAGINQFADWMLTSATAADWNAVNNASSSARRWDEPNYIDLGDFVSRVAQSAVSTPLAAAADNILDSLDNVVLHNYCGQYAPSTGISVYLPRSYGYISPTYNDGLDFVADTQWDEFVAACLTSSSAASTAALAASRSLVYGPVQPRDYQPLQIAVPFFFGPYSHSVQRKGTDSDGSTEITSSAPLKQTTSIEGGSPTSGDWYCVEVSAGDWLTAWTTTPGDGDLDFQNYFDPYIELYDPNGQLVAADDNTVYGRNALVSLTAELSEQYWIRVDASPLDPESSGQYFLRILGPDGPQEPLWITGTDLPQGSRRSEIPTSVTIEFSDQILLSSLHTSDLTIDGTSDALDFTVISGNTISFALPADLGEGTHSLDLAAGAILDIQGTPLAAYTSTFDIDTLPPHVIDSSIQQNDILPLDRLIYEAVFDQPLAGSGLDTSDVILTGATSGQIEALALNYDPDTYTLSIEFPLLKEDNYCLRLISGDTHFEDKGGFDLDGEPLAFPIAPNISGNGIPGGDFYVDFSVEIDTDRVPEAALQELHPGSLMREFDIAGSIWQVGDMDTLTLDLQAGQTLAVALDPASTMIPLLFVTDPEGNTLGSTIAQIPGKDVFLQAATVTVDGTYSILVGSNASTGSYDLRIIVNAGIETETYTQLSNNTLPAAQSLNNTFISLDGEAGSTAQRAAVLGSLGAEQGCDFYSFSLDALQTTSVALASTSGMNFTVDLLDSAGNLLTTGIHTDSAAAAIHAFSSTISETYYLRVTGEADYSLLVTRDAEFQREPNDTSLDAQDVSTSGGALGFLDASQAPSQDEDWYRFWAGEGDTITVETFLPLDGVNPLDTTLDPAVSLYDPAGNLLLFDDNSAADGINALLAHEASQSGYYRLQVLAQDGRGDYFVRVDAGDAIPDDSAPHVTSADPLDGSTVALFPTTYTVNFSESLLSTSLHPEDLTIEGIAATSFEIVDGDTVAFQFDPQLFTAHGDGAYQVAMAAGAVTDLQGSGNLEFYGTFVIDTTAPRIVETAFNGLPFPADAELTSGYFEFEAVFDEALCFTENGGSNAPDAEDISLVETNSLVEYTPFTVDYDPQTYRFRAVFDSLPAGVFELVLKSQDGSFEDAVGNDLDGESGPAIDGTPSGDAIPGGDYSITFTTSAQSQVVGRHVFYNNSHWDGNDITAGADDDPAIDPTKTALLPGNTATFANYTSYASGINGIMIDVDNLNPTFTPDIQDFTFRQGNSNDPSTWAEAPQPLSISLRRGQGVDGSDRITVIWADGAITNQWLQVTLSDQRLGLSNDDVFYWGNAIAETGDQPGQTLVNSTDVMAARNHPQGPTDVSDTCDFNRDGFVDTTDVAIAQANKTSPLTALRLIETPVVALKKSDAIDAVFGSPLLLEPIPFDPATMQQPLIGPALPPKTTATAWFFHLEKLRHQQSPGSAGADGDTAHEELIDLVLRQGWI